MFTGYDALIVLIGVAMGFVLHASIASMQKDRQTKKKLVRALVEDRIRIIRAYCNGELLGWRISAGRWMEAENILVFKDGEIVRGEDFNWSESDPITYYPCAYFGENHAVVCYDKDDNSEYAVEVEVTDAALDARDLPPVKGSNK